MHKSKNKLTTLLLTATLVGSISTGSVALAARSSTSAVEAAQTSISTTVSKTKTTSKQTSSTKSSTKKTAKTQVKSATKTAEETGKWETTKDGIDRYKVGSKYPTGWITYKGKSYFMIKDGSKNKMAFSEWRGGYRLASNGVCITDKKDQHEWSKSKDGWLYVGKTSGKSIGWQKIDGWWYYFDKKTGIMKTGLNKIGDNLCYMDANGKMVSSSWVEVKGTNYYFDKDGKAVDGWQTIDKNTYYFVNHIPQTGMAVKGSDIYWADSDGKMKKIDMQYTAAYNITSNHLTKRNGSLRFNGHRETWYSTHEAGGQSTARSIPGKHVANDGTIRDKDGFICVAASDRPYYSVVMTTVGPGKVYDCGCRKGTVDVYTTW